MIEIIREEYGRTERKELPKDIKQIGKPDIGERIYVENQTYELLHRKDDRNEKVAFVLLGSFENCAGRECTFVEAAIRLEEMTFDGELPVWNDQTWAYIYQRLGQEHDSMAIVGWAMDIKGELPNLTIRLEALHRSHFGGMHQILFLMDSLEGEETFYGNRNGHLSRREGFYIYSSTHAAVDVETEHIEEKPLEETAEESDDAQTFSSEAAWQKMVMDRGTLKNMPQGNYRQKILEQAENAQRPAYVSSFALFVVVCVLGITAYANYQRVNVLQETLAQVQMQGSGNNKMQMETTESEAGWEEKPADVQVETVEGNVYASNEQETQVQEEETSVVQEETTVTTTNVAKESPEPVEVPTLTEAQTYLEQGYYVVQKGDSLVGICKRIYQTTALMDKLCELNEIEDENAIYAGQRLILPN